MSFVTFHIWIFTPPYNLRYVDYWLHPQYPGLDHRPGSTVSSWMGDRDTSIDLCNQPWPVGPMEYVWFRVKLIKINMSKIIYMCHVYRFLK